MIAGVPAGPLAPRVLLLSLGVALFAWPLLWLLLAAAQGVGVVIAGGGFIGVSLPLGQYPWALVNQPEVNFASTRAGLWGYWLPSALLAVALAAGLPVLAPGPRRWGGELALHHLGFGAAVLGLGWAPALGCGDGPARGLERFFAVPSLAFVAGCALAGACLGSLPAIRLAGALWHDPQPVSRPRRLAVVLFHGVLPALLWLALATALGWRPGLLPLAALATVLLGPVATLLQRMPRAALQRRETPSPPQVLAAWLLGGAALALALWAGAPEGRSPRGVLWGKPLATNNIRTDWRVVPLRGGLVKPGQGERGWVP